MTLVFPQGELDRTGVIRVTVRGGREGRKKIHNRRNVHRAVSWARASSHRVLGGRRWGGGVGVGVDVSRKG